MNKELKDRKKVNKLIGLGRFRKGLVNYVLFEWYWKIDKNFLSVKNR